MYHFFACFVKLEIQKLKLHVFVTSQVQKGELLISVDQGLT